MALRFNFLILSSFLIGVLFFVPNFVFAGEGLVTCGGTDCDFCTLISSVYNVIRWLAAIAALLAGIVLIYSGFKMVTAGGDTSGYVEAKKHFFNAVIGIIIVLAVVAVIYTLLMTLLNANAQVADVKTGKFFTGFDCGEQTNRDEGDGLPVLDGAPPPPSGTETGGDNSNRPAGSGGRRSDSDNTPTTGSDPVNPSTGSSGRRPDVDETTNPESDSVDQVEPSTGSSGRGNSTDSPTSDADESVDSTPPVSDSYTYLLPCGNTGCSSENVSCNNSNETGRIEEQVVLNSQGVPTGQVRQFLRCTSN